MTQAARRRMPRWLDGGLHARMRYVALAVATMALGLAVHRGGGALSPAVRDVLGDALWAAMVSWWIAAAAPAIRLSRRAAAAVACCSPSSSASCTMHRRSTRSAGRLRDTLCSGAASILAISPRMPPECSRRCCSNGQSDASAPTGRGCRSARNRLAALVAMPRDPNHRFAKDPRDSATLAALAIDEPDEIGLAKPSRSSTIVARPWSSGLPENSRPPAILCGEAWRRTSWASSGGMRKHFSRSRSTSCSPCSTTPIRGSSL